MSPEPETPVATPFSVDTFVEIGRDGGERRGATLTAHKKTFLLRDASHPVEPEAVAVTGLFGPVRLESLVMELTVDEAELERLYAAFGIVRRTRSQSTPGAGRRQKASLFLAEAELRRAAKRVPAAGAPEVRLAALMEQDPQLFISLDRWSLKGGVPAPPAAPEVEP